MDSKRSMNVYDVLYIPLQQLNIINLTPPIFQAKSSQYISQRLKNILKHSSTLESFELAKIPGYRSQPWVESFKNKSVKNFGAFSIQLIHQQKLKRSSLKLSITLSS